MSEMVLRMPKTESPCNAGLNNAGIETYKNDPMISLTKEEEQNSTDGCQRDSSGKPKRVEIEFHDFKLPTASIPDIERLREVYSDEKAYWSTILHNDTKTENFFKNGIKLLAGKEVRVLRISDKMTTGLNGIDEESSPWANLVTNVGVSDKPSSAGGSFGIGKDAAFACSQLRLVFYSTRNTDGDSATQGTLKLPSFKKETVKYEGTGFFADKENPEIKPARECISLDPNYRRTDYGLDKYIIGFDEKMSSKELKEAVIKSSIANFLVAFFMDSLEVRYDDIVVNKLELPNIFEKYGDQFDPIVREQYATLVNPDKVVRFALFDENDVTFYVRLDPDASRRAAVIRSSGMKVFDKGNISGRVGFSAVVTLNSENINSYFKLLENPEHNKWAPERAASPAEARKYIKTLFDKLRDIIKEMHQEDYDNAVDADGLNEYLPFAYVQKSKKNKTEGLSIEVKEKRKKAKKKKTPPQLDTEEVRYKEDEFGNIDESTIELVSNNGTSGGAGTGTGGGGGNGGGQGGFGGEGSDNGTNGQYPDQDGDESRKYTEDEQGEFISKRRIPGDNFSFALSQDAGEYCLRLISAKKVASGFVEVSISAEEEAVAADILSASIDTKATKISRNKISFAELTPGNVHNIRFKLKNAGDWALEVTVNEN